MSAQGSSGNSVSFARHAWRGARWVLLALLILLIALLAYRYPTWKENQATPAAVAAIHAQKLTKDDVDGNHLPPPPDPAQADATVAGVDVNGNGIRDDVELAIFKKYPGDSNAKIRAAELQYAMALQTELTQVFNSETWVAASQEQERGLGCMLDAIPNNQLNTWFTDQSEVKKVVFNTEARKQKFENSGKFEVSFSLIQGQDCDVSFTNSKG